MRPGTTIILWTTTSSVTLSVLGFTVVPSYNNNKVSRTSSTTALNGLFDGVKEAFSAPALERSQIDAERETPIDRWMGWSVRSENSSQEAVGTKTPESKYC